MLSHRGLRALDARSPDAPARHHRGPRARSSPPARLSTHRETPGCPHLRRLTAGPGPAAAQRCRRVHPGPPETAFPAGAEFPRRPCLWSDTRSLPSYSEQLLSPPASHYRFSVKDLSVQNVGSKGKRETEVVSSQHLASRGLPCVRVPPVTCVPRLRSRLLRMHFLLLIKECHARACQALCEGPESPRARQERGVETERTQDRNCGHSQEEGHVEPRA